MSDVSDDRIELAEPAPARQGGFLTRARWSPYLVGIGIGLLSIAAFGIVNKPLGMSTQVSQTAGACMIPAIGEDAVRSQAYWAKEAKPVLDYGMIMFIGTFVGALLSAIVSRSFKLEAVPAVWRERYGGNWLWRFVGAFVGGGIMIYGARLAGGCTSGHGISGGLQLALSSWVFFGTMFVVGVITALLIYGFGNKREAQA